MPNLRNVTPILTSNRAFDDYYLPLEQCERSNSSVASSPHFRVNPKGKPPINALQMKTFATSGKLDLSLSIIKDTYLLVFENVIERLAQIIYGIWTDIVHNLRGLLDSIKGNTQPTELK